MPQRNAGRIGRRSDRRRPYLQGQCGAGRMWASVRLLKQRRAFTTEIVSAITVMDKSTKSACRVKHLMEKDHPRVATLILLVSRGSRGSRVSGPLGVWTSQCHTGDTGMYFWHSHDMGSAGFPLSPPSHARGSRFCCKSGSSVNQHFSLCLQRRVGVDEYYEDYG
jgi:hypothetical protein